MVPSGITWRYHYSLTLTGGSSGIDVVSRRPAFVSLATSPAVLTARRRLLPALL